MSHKILVVAGDENINLELKNYFKDEDEQYQFIFSNIFEKKTAIEVGTFNIDLVIIDINLKTLQNGLDLAKELLLEDKIPFIYTSSLTDKITLELVKDTRPYGFLVKPFKKEDIITAVFLILNNFSLKNIDRLRSKQDLTNVPITIRNVIAYINENIYEKIEIDDLSKITRWKNHHFIRTFTKEIGETPYQYILRKKIEIAKSLIGDTQQPINEIAYDLGFYNYSNFICIFKKFCKNTPENFRKATAQKKQQN